MKNLDSLELRNVIGGTDWNKIFTRGTTGPFVPPPPPPFPPVT